MSDTSHNLQVLIANEQEARLARISKVVEDLGHEVVARDTDVVAIGRISRQFHADVALVGLGLDGQHALELISEIVQEAACPVIALLDVRDPAYVKEAAKRGIFAYVVLDGDDNDLVSALDITLRRFAEFQNLQGAFGRRATIEQAKGILMARNAVNADDAFQLLRAHSQRTGQKLVDVAEAIIETHLLLPGAATPQAPPQTGTE